MRVLRILPGNRAGRSTLTEKLTVKWMRDTMRMIRGCRQYRLALEKGSNGEETFMYKAVETYIDKLETMREETFEQYPCVVEYCDMAGSVPVGIAERDRNRAVTLLERLFIQYSWSDEFVTAFGVYCNFYVLTGMHKCLKEDFGLEKLYAMLEDEEDIQYLEYIRKGIYHQEEKMFLHAIGMNIYDFSIPWLYVYFFCLKHLTSYTMEELQKKDEQESFINIYNGMESAEKNIAQELKECIQINRIPFCGLGAFLSDIYQVKYIPHVYILDDILMYAACAVSDMGMLKQYGHMEKIASFEDFSNGLGKAACNEEDARNYVFFSGELFGRIDTVAYLSGDYNSRAIDSEKYERDGVLLDRRYYLKLPMGISEEGATYVHYARQLKLRLEKEKLIEKNRKMVEDYSHSIENIIKPSLISDIADLLKKDEKYREVYRKLVQAYFSEVTTQNECRLLRMTHDFETSSGAIRENISRCKAEKPGNAKGVVSFEDLLYKAVNQVMFQIVDDKRSRMQFIRDKISKAGLDLQLVDQSLWGADQDKDRIFAFWKKFFQMDCCVEDALKDQYFWEEAVGTTFLYTRMVELLTNMFTYKEYGSGKGMTFSVKLEEKDGKRSYLVFETCNRIGDRGYASGKNGLVSMEEMLNRMNGYDPDRDVFVESGEEGEIFRVRVFIEAGLYI